MSFLSFHRLQEISGSEILSSSCKIRAFHLFSHILLKTMRLIKEALDLTHQTPASGQKIWRELRHRFSEQSLCSQYLRSFPRGFLFTFSVRWKLNFDQQTFFEYLQQSFFKIQFFPKLIDIEITELCYFSSFYGDSYCLKAHLSSFSCARHFRVNLILFQPYINWHTSQWTHF